MVDLSYCVDLYGFIVPWNCNYKMTEWASEIEKNYSVKNPVNRAVVDYLRRFDGIIYRGYFGFQVRVNRG